MCIGLVRCRICGSGFANLVHVGLFSSENNLVAACQPCAAKFFISGVHSAASMTSRLERRMGWWKANKKKVMNNSKSVEQQSESADLAEEADDAAATAVAVVNCKPKKRKIDATVNTGDKTKERPVKSRRKGWC